MKQDNAGTKNPGQGSQTQVCPKCGHENDPKALRCDACDGVLQTASSKSALPISAPPPEAIVQEKLRLCVKCAHQVPDGAATCPSCGTLLGAARKDIIRTQRASQGYLGLIAFLMGFLSMILLKVGAKITFGGGIATVIAGVLAFKRDEQPALGFSAIVIGILDVFIAIAFPLF